MQIDLSNMIVAEQLVDPVVQRELDWLELRRGKITASNFGVLVSQGKKGNEFTDQGFAYLRLKVAERLGSFHTFKAKSTEWGKQHEAQAIDEYAALQRVSVDSTPFRFIELSNDIGGTPDGLVGDDGAIEVKAPWNPENHIKTLLTKTVPREYVWQVHGHLLVTGRQWCDFISFDPRIEGPNRLAIVRVERDAFEIDELLNRLDAGVEWIEKTLKSLAHRPREIKPKRIT